MADGSGSAGTGQQLPVDASTRANGPSNLPSSATKVQQPKPQALPARSGPNSILVSSRQKGNSVLNNIRSFPWEYADIAADYVLGATTCVLFLSLKYHRLHPEYIYQRIRDIAGKYNLRVLLIIVDIQNHEEPLKELSKTSLINNVTLILCWSAQEAARYLELYKSCEHAAPTAIRAHQATGYSDKLVEFITTPRSINKTDAVSLISSFGSIRTAINAAPEDVALVPGFGAKKVQRWCNTVREPFRVRKAARRGIPREDSLATALPRNESRLSMSRDASRQETADDDEAVVARLGVPSIMAHQSPQRTGPVERPLASNQTTQRPANGIHEAEEDEDLVMLEANVESVPGNAMSKPMQVTKPKDPGLSDGIAAALARLRQEK